MANRNKKTKPTGLGNIDFFTPPTASYFIKRSRLSLILSSVLPSMCEMTNTSGFMDSSM